jgi:hypothetical protein
MPLATNLTLQAFFLAVQLFIPGLLSAALLLLPCLFCPTQKSVASKGRGILAMDESNATCGKRLDSIGVENTVDNRRAYRELLITTPGLGQYISGAILFEV